MSSFPGRAYPARAVVARRPLCRARKEFITRTASPTISGWTRSFPRTWLAPRAPAASISKLAASAPALSC